LKISLLSLFNQKLIKIWPTVIYSNIILQAFSYNSRVQQPFQFSYCTKLWTRRMQTQTPLTFRINGEEV
jgi:hypothetical protein